VQVFRDLYGTTHKAFAVEPMADLLEAADELELALAGRVRQTTPTIPRSAVHRSA
jgi:hypothetical protein